MKRVHAIVVILVALTLVMFSSSPLVSAQNTSQHLQESHDTFLAGIIGVWILLMILIPTVAFLFSGGGRRERGRVAGWSLAGILLGGIFSVVISNTNFFAIAILVYIAFIVALSIAPWLVRLLRILNLNLLLSPLPISAQGIVNWWNSLDRNVRAFFISAFVVLVVIVNLTILLKLGIGRQDFLALLFNYSLFGVPLTFLVIGGGIGFWAGIFGVFIVELIGIGMLINGRTNLIPVGLLILVVFGYAVIFIQIELKTLFMSELDELRDNLRARRRVGNRITQVSSELNTFFDIIAGGVITAGSTVLALSFSHALLGSENFNCWMKVIQKAIGSIFIFYIGILIFSIFLLRADDVLRQARSQPPRLTLQNVIAILLIVLGIGGLAILEINPTSSQNLPPYLPPLVFGGEAFLSVIILSNRRASRTKR